MAIFIAFVKKNAGFLGNLGFSEINVDLETIFLPKKGL
jgi:hypothetical protein